MRVQRSPGESIEVDWAGDAMIFADPLTGAGVEAWLFVAACSFSAYICGGVRGYDSTVVDRRACPAFEAFGGTCRLLVPDNLRTGVSRADRYEPVLLAGRDSDRVSSPRPAREQRPGEHTRVTRTRPTMPPYFLHRSSGLRVDIGRRLIRRLRSAGRLLVVASEDTALSSPQSVEHTAT